MKRLLGTLALSLICAAATAADPASAADPQMMLTLKSKYPSTSFREVRRTPIPGVFEVVMGNNLAYVDASGRYFFFGALWDMETQTDMSEPKVAALKQEREAAQARQRMSLVSAMPIQDAIKTVKGNGSRVMYVFSDPNCSFCKRLETTLEQAKDVTIYTFLYPILGQDSVAKAQSLWCQPDRSAAYVSFMTRGGAIPQSGACDTPLERNAKLGRTLGVDGTPAIFSNDGRMLSGARPLDQIEAFLAAPSLVQAQAR